MKRKISICACSLILLLSSIFNSDGVYAATSTLGDWDKVDSGGHLDWGGATNYMVQFTSAVNTWNGYKSGVIRKDTWKIIQDVSISDYSGDDTTMVVIKSNGTIKFNQKVMDKFSDDEKENICAYALGRMLGLGGTNNDEDVMYKKKCSNTTLTDNDKASYDAAAKNY